MNKDEKMPPDWLGSVEMLDYDGVIKTLLDKMPDKTIVEIINSEFSRDYPIDAAVNRIRTESHSGKSGSDLKKRSSDYLIEVDGAVYNFEFQTSDDNSMSFRIFEYGVRSAMTHGRTDSADSVSLTFPNPVVYYLRNSDKTPTELTVTLKFPQGVEVVNGDTMQYKIPARRASDYTPSELADQFKPLLMPLKLLNRLGKINEKNCAEFIREFSENIRAIAKLKQSGKLPPNIADSMAETTCSMADIVVNKSKIPNKEEVVNEMYRAVLDERGEVLIPNFFQVQENIEKFKAKARAEGEAKARAEGKAEGKAEGMAELAKVRVRTIVSLLSQGIDRKVIAQIDGYGAELVSNVAEKFKAQIESKVKENAEPKHAAKKHKPKL